MIPRLERPIAALSLVLGVLALTGCASEKASRVTEAPAHAPARWQAVMLPEETAAETSDIVWAWWDERRDGEVGVRYQEPLLASNQWPEPERASLERPRYISLPNRPDTLLYFRPERRW